MIKNIRIFIFLFFSITIINSQNTTIPEANPFCSDTGILFDNTSDGSDAELGPDYGCLASQPNPSWFYIKIDEPGDLTLEIEQNSQADFNGTPLDVDFIAWGPFSEARLEQIQNGNYGLLSGFNEVDCSFSVDAIETLNIVSDESFLQTVKTKSEKTFKELNKLKSKYPKYIKSIKGKGLFIGIEFDFDNIISNIAFKKIRIPFIKNIKTVLMGAIIREYLHEHKILLHFTNAQPETLVFLPPLIISDEEINIFIESTKKVLEKGLLNLFVKFIVGNIKGN